MREHGSAWLESRRVSGHRCYEPGEHEEDRLESKRYESEVRCKERDARGHNAHILGLGYTGESRRELRTEEPGEVRITKI